MTAAVSVKARPASLSMVGIPGLSAPITVCRNPECSLELSSLEKARMARYNGLCEDCHDDGVIVPPLADMVNAEAEARQARKTADVAHLDTIDGTTGEIRVCGNCDGNISDMPGAEFCSGFCASAAEQNVTTTDDDRAADQPHRPAPGTVEVRYVQPTKTTKDPATKAAAKAAAKAVTTRETPMSVALEIVVFAYPEIAEYAAEIGLRAAVKHWANGRVAGQGINAAARAWIPTGHDFDEMDTWAQAQARTKALRVLKSAIRAAQEFRAANQPTQ